MTTPTKDGRRRKSQSKVLFTEEFLKELPVGSTHMDFWYDTEQPYLMARRVKADAPVTFHVNRSQYQRAAYTAIYGQDPGRYATIGPVGLAVAREASAKMWAEMQLIRTRYENMSGPIPDATGDDPEGILKDKAPVEDPNYDKLMDVMMEAFNQARHGKGNAVHGTGLHFEDQDMLAVMDRVGKDFALGQAIKKITEGRRKNMLDARKEFLGAMVYVAGAIIWMDKRVK